MQMVADLGFPRWGAGGGGGCQPQRWERQSIIVAIFLKLHEIAKKKKKKKKKKNGPKGHVLSAPWIRQWYNWWIVGIVSHRR